MSVHLGLNELSNSTRKNAWLLMLKIDEDSEEYKFHKELFSDFLIQKIEPKSAQASIDNMIVKDVYRTFSLLQKFN
jgi:hypothetical protein